VSATPAYRRRVIAQRARERSVGISKEDASGRWLAANDPTPTVQERLLDVKPEPAREARPCQHPTRKLRPTPSPEPELCEAWRCAACGVPLAAIRILPREGLQEATESPRTRREARET
jgi:hypothetical protein